MQEMHFGTNLIAFSVAIAIMRNVILFFLYRVYKINIYSNIEKRESEDADNECKEQREQIFINRGRRIYLILIR